MTPRKNSRSRQQSQPTRASTVRTLCLPNIAMLVGPNVSNVFAGATARWYRWLFGGLHRIDFTASMRARPAWDIIMLTLMLGGLALTSTGFYLALRRIRNDIALLSRFIGRRKPALA